MLHLNNTFVTVYFTDMKALEQEHKLKLAKEENTALLETIGEINTISSSCPLTSVKGEVSEQRKRKRERGRERERDKKREKERGREKERERGRKREME